VREPGVKIGNNVPSGHIPRNVRSHRAHSPYPCSSISYRSCRLVSGARVDIAEVAGVSKAELDDIVAVIEWYARVWYRGEHSWKGTSTWDAEERPTRGAGPAGAGAGAAVATIRAGSEGAGTNGGKDEAAIGRTDGAVMGRQGARTGRKCWPWE